MISSSRLSTNTTSMASRQKITKPVGRRTRRTRRTERTTRRKGGRKRRRKRSTEKGDEQHRALSLWRVLCQLVAAVGKRQLLGLARLSTRSTMLRQPDENHYHTSPGPKGQSGHCCESRTDRCSGPSPEGRSRHCCSGRSWTDRCSGSRQEGQSRHCRHCRSERRRTDRCSDRRSQRHARSRDLTSDCLCPSTLAFRAGRCRNRRPARAPGRSGALAPLAPPALSWTCSRTQRPPGRAAP